MYPLSVLSLPKVLGLLAAASDGIALISEWSLNPPGGVSGRRRG
ncbi:hypothetical protein [Chromobacterium alkanivorans]|nr:hypothetical protein [Chromobacterium alkanivorans]